MVGVRCVLSRRLLFDGWCSLFVVGCFFGVVVRCLLCVDWCLQFVVCCWVVAVCCLLLYDCCLLFVD